jgi:thioredoxin-related protein
MGKIIILIHEKCPHCEIIKKKLGKDERFRIMDVSKEPDAKELAVKLGINTVPYFLYADEHGQVCTLEADGNVGKCVRNRGGK